MALEAIETGRHVPLDEIAESQQKVRVETVEQRLDDLSNSIKEHGQIHAVSLLQDVSTPDGKYELINGHRRYQAARRGGLKTLRANIYRIPAGEEKNRDLLIQQHLYAANMAEPLIPVERARMFEALMREYKMSAEQVASCFEGETAVSVAEAMKYLAIDQVVLDVISAHPEKFSEGHIRVLAEFSSPDKRAWRMKPDEQLRVAREVAEQKDKLVAADPRKLEERVKSVVKMRRDQERARNEKVKKSQADPVKSLFRAVEAVENAVRNLRELDLLVIKEIDAVDKGDVMKRLYETVQSLDDFANDRLSKLSTSRKSAK
ncbi:ParB/RepB/Spo0J family partition protein [Streptomyces plumbiresistens]|uniref:ParB-like N-terminal domain-containing protein n=1 Tax=Streptomyces plumbiresistens TaxID=511811 RepID=A0ABP7RWD2_9ACTN